MGVSASWRCRVSGRAQPVRMESVIQVDGLVKKFGGTTALAGVDLVARPGAVLGLLGPNGSGKTTTVRVLATLLRPDAGCATVFGHDVVTDAAAVRGRIGLTGQYAAVDEALTGTNNLMLIARLLDLSRSAARARSAELVERFGLTEAAGRKVRTYSGGMRRRLDLAASLIGRPDILFLDEPTTGLDPRHRNEVWDSVRGLAADGVTVLLTTQYLEEADRLADDLVVLDRGRVIAAGTPASLKADIGGQRLHVRPLHRTDMSVVAAVVADLAPDQAAVIDTSGELVVPAPTPDLLRRVADRLEDTAVAVAEIGLRLPSLDDVFMTLTGRAPETEAA
jgi:oleandomycin transport system ATP-binding protein